MIIELPRTLTVNLTNEEHEAIENCIMVLNNIQDEMMNYDCNILEDVNGSICTSGQIDDIKSWLRVIRDADSMFEG